NGKLKNANRNFLNKACPAVQYKCPPKENRVVNISTDTCRLNALTFFSDAGYRMPAMWLPCKMFPAHQFSRQQLLCHWHRSILLAPAYIAKLHETFRKFPISTFFRLASVCVTKCFRISDKDKSTDSLLAQFIWRIA